MRRLLPMILASVALPGFTACSSERQTSEQKQAGEAQRERAGEELTLSLEQWIRRGFEFSWQSGQPMRDEVRQVWSQLGSGGVGYGFRTFQARVAPPGSIPSMQYWRVTLDELHTSLVGDIGLAWGVHTEEFKVQGQPPETVRVRFTNTLAWNGQQWESLLYHRDAQAFGEDGRYLKARE